MRQASATNTETLLDSVNYFRNYYARVTATPRPALGGRAVRNLEA